MHKLVRGKTVLIYAGKKGSSTHTHATHIIDKRAYTHIRL